MERFTVTLQRLTVIDGLFTQRVVTVTAETREHAKQRAKRKCHDNEWPIHAMPAEPTRNWQF